VELGAAFQLWTAEGKNSGLWTHIATMESVSLCVQMKADCACGTQSGALEAKANETVSTERQTL
jgi:hypothetical protein